MPRLRGRAEAVRIARDLGPNNQAMILRNHGILTCSERPCQALSHMRYLVEACELQVEILAMGREVNVPTPEVCERAAKQSEASEALGPDYVWNAYLRVADRIDRSFRD